MAVRRIAGSGPTGPSAATGNFKKLLPAGDAEILDRVESIPFESHADLFHRHVRLGVEVDDLATARFGRDQDRVSSHEPSAAENAVELHERLVSPKTGAGCAATTTAHVCQYCVSRGFRRGVCAWPGQRDSRRPYLWEQAANSDGRYPALTLS